MALKLTEKLAFSVSYTEKICIHVEIYLIPKSGVPPVGLL